MRWFFLGMCLVLAQVATAQIDKDDDPFGGEGYTFKELDLSQVRSWQGKNNKSINGLFLKEEDGLIHVLSLKSDRQIYKLDPKNLSKKTLDWFEAAKAFRDRKPVKVKPRVNDPNDPFGPPTKRKASEDEFKPIDRKNLDRSQIKAYDPSVYGLKNDQNGILCFVPFFIWWDQNSNLPIAKGRKFKDKAQWVYKELEKRFDRGRNLASGIEFRKTFTDYFKDNYKDEVTFSLSHTRVTDIGSLSNATKGSAATVIRLFVFSGDRLQWHIDASLANARDDGSISLIVFNQEIGATLVPLEKDEVKRLRRHDEQYWHVKFDPGTAVPERLKKIRDFRFLISESCSLFILNPLLKEKKEAPEDKKP